MLIRIGCEREREREGGEGRRAMTIATFGEPLRFQVSDFRRRRSAARLFRERRPGSGACARRFAFH